MAQRPRRSLEQSNMLMKQLSGDLRKKDLLLLLRSAPKLMVKRELGIKIKAPSMVLEDFSRLEEMEELEGRIAAAMEALLTMQRILVRIPEEVEVLCTVREWGWKGYATIPISFLPRKRSEMLVKLESHGFITKA